MQDSVVDTTITIHLNNFNKSFDDVPIIIADARASIRSTKSLKTELQLAYSTSHYSSETLRRLLNSLIHFRTTHYLAGKGKGEKPVEGKFCLSEEWRPFRKHSANNWILGTSRWWARINITYMFFYSILFFTGFFDHLTLTNLLTTASRLKQSSLKFQERSKSERIEEIYNNSNRLLESCDMSLMESS